MAKRPAKARVSVSIYREIPPYFIDGIDWGNYYDYVQENAIYRVDSGKNGDTTHYSLTMKNTTDYLLRVSYGKWRESSSGWVFDNVPPPPWWSATGSRSSFSYSHSDYVWIEVDEILNSDGTPKYPDEYYTSGQNFVSGPWITIAIMKRRAGQGDDPYPFDPNQPPPPPPPPPPQGELKLWCKVGGTVHKAKQAYIKQNGVLIPVKKILGG
ncbi:MAG: hypothetical protein Q4A78_09980 [Peptostreptococcaceae bacterium]|nr:hypothetical protein [Peptostreptococcaceae bacterium]